MSLNFHDLRTFVAKFCCRDLRTFSANFFTWKINSANFFAFRMYARVKSRTWPLFNFQQAPTGALYVVICQQIRMLTPRSAFLIINPKPAPSLPVWSTPPIGCQPPLAEASPPSQTLKIFFISVWNSIFLKLCPHHPRPCLQKWHKGHPSTSTLLYPVSLLIGCWDDQYKEPW